MRGSIVLALTLTAGIVVACTASYPPCYRGDYRGCACEAAGGATPPATGYQACAVTQDGFEACVCNGRTPGVDAGRDASSSEGGENDGGASEGGEGGAYLAPCSATGACTGEGALCVTFGNKGKICTKRCAGPTDCPPPSLGCSPNMGVCRPP